MNKTTWADWFVATVFGIFYAVLLASFCKLL